MTHKRYLRTNTVYLTNEQMLFAAQQDVTQTYGMVLHAVLLLLADLGLGGGISIGCAIGIGASCILSLLPGKMKHEKLFHDRNQGVSKPRRDGASLLLDSEVNSGSGR